MRDDFFIEVYTTDFARPLAPGATTISQGIDGVIVTFDGWED